MMEQILRIGATAGVIGFVAVGVFGMCCIGALAIVGLGSWVAQKIGGHDDEADTTHTH
jgi:hypothetical protein